jgi:EamA domain-containing membrane protein RarD
VVGPRTGILGPTTGSEGYVRLQEEGIGMRTFVVATLTFMVGLVLFDRGPGLNAVQILIAIACAVVAAIAYDRVRRRAR